MDTETYMTLLEWNTHNIGANFLFLSFDPSDMQSMNMDQTRIIVVLLMRKFGGCEFQVCISRRGRGRL